MHIIHKGAGGGGGGGGRRCVCVRGGGGAGFIVSYSIFSPVCYKSTFFFYE